MEIDINDILAELDRDTTAVEQEPTQHSDSDDITKAPSSSQGHMTQKALLLDDKTANKITDFERLLGHWRNERMSPELLPYPHDVMERTLARIQDQVELIENLSMGFIDSHTNVVNDSKLPLLCMEAELERLKFVIRSYVRCRLSKIDKYSIYLRQKGDIQEGGDYMRLDLLMSQQEREYHIKHSDILIKLFNNSILKNLPEELQAINDTEGSVSMIDEPDWNKTVFILVCGGVTDETGIDSKLTTDEDNKPCYSVVIEELNEEIYLLVGAVYVIRYIAVRDLVQEGRVILI